MDKKKNGWERLDLVKYEVSKFEEEEFKKWFENGGREKLKKKVQYFDYSPYLSKAVQPKQGRYW